MTDTAATAATMDIVPGAGDVAAETPQHPGVEFTGLRTPLFNLLVKNALLTLFTLGIYRFWARTKVRQYFWNNVKLGGQPFEYLGTGGELFKGFLVVLVILVPLGFVYGLLETLLAGGNPAAVIWLNVAFYAVIGLLIQVAVYRMWRYRLSRTAWRGVRFGLDGSTVAYVRRSVIWGLATLASLGIAVPYARRALMGYRVNNMRFGDRPFSFDDRTPIRPILVPWLVLIGLVIAIFLVPLGIAASSLTPEQLEALRLGGTVNLGGGKLSAHMGLTVLGMPLILLAVVWYRVKEAHVFAGATKFESAEFRSQLRQNSVLWAGFLTVLAFIGFVVALGIFAPFAWGFSDAVVKALFASGLDAQTAGFVSTIGLSIVGLVVFLVFSSIMTTLIFQVMVTRRFCRTLSVSDPRAFDGVAQSADTGPRRGEGLADAFDVGAF